MKEFSRREMLYGMGMAGLALAIGDKALTHAPEFWIRGKDYFHRESIEHDISVLRGHLRSRYGIEYGVRKHTSYGVGATLKENDEATEESLSKFTELKALHAIREALSLYPPLVIRGRVKDFLITTTLRHEGEGVAGTFHLSLKKITVRHRDARSIVSEKAVGHRVIHHEIGHALTLPSAELLTYWSIVEDRKYVGESWKKLPPTPVPGYVSRYAVKSPYEDMAETWEYMMTNPRVAFGEKDPVIRQKVVLLLDFVDRFLQKGRGAPRGLDTEYWARRLRGDHIDETYWESPSSQQHVRSVPSIPSIQTLKKSTEKK